MDVIISSSAFILIVAACLFHCIRQRRRNEQLVRRWVDQQGYGMISFRGPGGVPGLSGGWADRIWGNREGTYELLVQDEQGGQINFTITVSFTGKIKVRRL
ncbi:MAG: hypothetical protein QGG42_13325 [Phycisphaerae bacterium]|jgi:hypothetical protein|nr:hypothetical protein [Phycisphaerae bacterium]